MVSGCIVAEVGKFYMVPCVRLLVEPMKQHPAANRDGWVPTIGPEHHDRETIGFTAMHTHIDVRFLSDAAVQRSRRWWAQGAEAAQSVLGFPVSTWSDGVGATPLPHERAMRRMKCRRPMPEFPAFSAVKWHRKLEAEHAGCKLKPGNICPRRGIDLTPFVKPDGTVVCPGHGLRWDTRTGDLLPYQASAA